MRLPPGRPAGARHGKA